MDWLTITTTQYPFPFWASIRLLQTTQEFKLGGSATFFGTVYAPGADLVLGGGGNGGEFVGSLAGKTASLVGNVQIRYDESLGGDNQILASFKIAAWFEDSSKDALLKGL